MTEKFSEYLGTGEDGAVIIRLGNRVYTKKDDSYFVKSSQGNLFQISSPELESKNWIVKNFDREIAYQKRKKLSQLAADLERSHIAERDRKEFKSKYKYRF